MNGLAEISNQLELLDQSRLQLHSDAVRFLSQPYSSRLSRAIEVSKCDLLNKCERIALLLQKVPPNEERDKLSNFLSKIESSIRSIHSSTSSASPSLSASSSPPPPRLSRESSLESFQQTMAPEQRSVMENEKRTTDYQELETSIQQIHEMVADMHYLTSDQQQQLDQMEDHIENAKQSTIAAEKDIRKAADYKAYGFVLAAGAAGALIGGPAGAILLAKTAMGAAGGAMALGAGGTFLGVKVGKGLEHVQKSGHSNDDSSSSSSTSSSSSSSSSSVSSSTPSSSASITPSSTKSEVEDSQPRSWLINPFKNVFSR